MVETLTYSTLSPYYKATISKQVFFLRKLQARNTSLWQPHSTLPPSPDKTRYRDPFDRAMESVQMFRHTCRFLSVISDICNGSINTQRLQGIPASGRNPRLANQLIDLCHGIFRNLCYSLLLRATYALRINCLSVSGGENESAYLFKDISHDDRTQHLAKQATSSSYSKRHYGTRADAGSR